jgi:sulfur carrier protein
MRVNVNGDSRDTDSMTVGALLRELGVDTDRRGSAVAVNDSVVPRAKWDDTPLSEADRVEVIRAVQGG